MRLAPLAQELAMTFRDDEKNDIDFQAAGLYLPAAQVVLSVVVASAASVVCCWVTSPRQTCAVRTLAITLFCGLAFVRRPIRVAQAKGVNTIFTALRMAVLIYILGLTIEQILHSCSQPYTEDDYEIFRRVLYHACMASSLFAGLWRARAPRSEHDGAFWVSTASFLVVAMVPPSAIPGTGPLCSAATLFGAAERLLRAFLFACIYCTIVYCSAPISNNLADQLVCIARACAASVWALGIHLFGLGFAPVQIGIMVYMTFGQGGGVAALQYDAVDLSMVPSCDASLHMPAAEPEPDPMELPFMPATPLQPMNGSGLRFNLAVSRGMSRCDIEDSAFQAAAARVAEEV